MSTAASIDLLPDTTAGQPSTPPSSQPLHSAKSLPIPPEQTQARPPPELPLAESISSSLLLTLDSVNSTEDRPLPVTKLNTILIDELPHDNSVNENHDHDPDHEYKHNHENYNQESSATQKRRAATRVPLTLKSILCTTHTKKRKPIRWVQFKGELLNDRIYKKNMISDVAVPKNEDVVHKVDGPNLEDNNVSEIKISFDTNDTDTDDDDYQPNGSDTEDEGEVYQEELFGKTLPAGDEALESRENSSSSSCLDSENNNDQTSIIDDLHQNQSSELMGSLNERMSFYLKNHDYDDAINLASCIMNKNMETEGISFSMLLKDSEMGFSSITGQEAPPRSLISRVIRDESSGGNNMSRIPRSRADMRDEWRRRKLICLQAESSNQKDFVPELVTDHFQSQSQSYTQPQNRQVSPPQVAFSSAPQSNGLLSFSSNHNNCDDSSLNLLLSGNVSSAKKRPHCEMYPSAVVTSALAETGLKKKRCLVPRRLGIKQGSECRSLSSHSDVFLR